MEILTTAKNGIFDIITKEGFNPLDFYLSGNDDYWTIKFLPKEGYMFHVYTVSKPGFKTGYRNIICPGEKYAESNLKYDYPRAPVEYEHNIKLWLSYIKREFTAVDKWDELKSKAKSLQPSFEGKEIPNDLESVKKIVLQIQDGLKNLNLPPAIETRININLNQTINFYTVDKTFDWFGYILGTVTAIIITMSVTPEQGKAIWNLIEGAFRKLLGN